MSTRAPGVLNKTLRRVDSAAPLSYPLGTLLEGSPVCTEIVDLDFRLQYMSAAGKKQLKISDIEPYYGSIFPPELYPESWRATVTEHLERAMDGEISSLECPVLVTEGSELWYDTTFVPARDQNRRLQCGIVPYVNITERRRAEKRDICAAQFISSRHSATKDTLAGRGRQALDIHLRA